MKFDFKQCDKCGKLNCLRCTLLAGKLGTVCKKCFQTLPKKRKEELSKEASRLKFWATNGYYIFICFLIIGAGSLALSIMEQLLLYLGFAFLVITFVYGLILFRILSTGKENTGETEQFPDDLAR